MKLIFNFILSICLTAGYSLSQIQSNYELPIATYGIVGVDDICNTGELSFTWDYCSLDSDINSIPDWTFIDATFSMGDGGTVFYDDTGFGPIQYTFSSFGITEISGQAKFKDEDGIIATVTIKNITDVTHNGDPCYLEQNPLEPATNFLSVDVYNVNVDFGVDIQGNAVDFYNYSQLHPSGQGSSGWSYRLYIDGQIEKVGSGLPSSSTSFHSETLSEGQYQAELLLTYSMGEGLNCSKSVSKTITVDEQDTCTNCNTFKPQIGERYWVSAWVKEDVSTPVQTYSNAELSIDFTGSGSPSVQFATSGEIIDGWQRIVGSFTVPISTTDLNINLDNNSSTHQIFFDDVRIHPYNASMKSYVYDPETLWLVAELDDNNYATFYEYDKEGKLVRIKKETSRGIMTIQESRSRTLKKENQ
ncbi:MAG: hypothetical protein COA32_14995 [Fluviicola sp.]|nr:MAG: hypothetical protein COA32_14995 [Fluviicola sp.]